MKPFTIFGYTVNIFKAKQNNELVDRDRLFKVVSDGSYLRLQTPEGNLIPNEITCSITVHNHCSEMPKATVQMFVDIRPLIEQQ